MSKRILWTAEVRFRQEDEALRKVVSQRGTKDWARVADILWRTYNIPKRYFVIRDWEAMSPSMALILKDRIRRDQVD